MEYGRPMTSGGLPAVGFDRFLDRMSRGPAVLFLGQRALALDTGEDPFLEQVGRKFGVPATTYEAIWQRQAAADGETLSAWLDERCGRIAPPEGLVQVAGYAWSAVFTSAVDTVSIRAFRAPWRALQPVLDENHRPADPRNRTRLHYSFLFGNVNRSSPSERIPLSRMEFLRRKPVAVAIARRMPEIVTPLGVLAIDGWDPTVDWFQSEDLLPILADLTEGQVHIFSAGAAVSDDPIVQELVLTGQVVLHTEPAAAALARGTAEGVLRLGAMDGGDSAHQIRLSTKTAAVPDEVWTRTRGTATVLDDAVLSPGSALSPEARYREFRNFLSATDGVPDWRAFARGLAFDRDFEVQLRSTVDRALAAPGFQDAAVVLHGATGSGKTVALGALARAIRLDGTHPVIYIERRAQAPSYGDLDLFCEWAEREGAPATLIAWDGMQEPSTYHDLLRYLGSRGRNVVVVGTSYRLSGQAARARGQIEAPSLLSPTERDRFTAFLKGFDPGLEDLVQRRGLFEDESFLVALYRLLPPVRGGVRAGVARELQHAERAMAEKASDVAVDYKPPNALARALAEAGLVQPGALSADLVTEIGTELVDDFQRLTGLVMVPARFGLRVPLELLLRALGHDGFQNFLDLMGSVDIFRWHEDASGNIEIGARSRLEAGLIAQARAGGPETELAFAQTLLLELRQDDQVGAGGREIDFAVALIRAIGPQGRDSQAFVPYFRQMAETLASLRLDRGVVSPRLMLQEANLLREYTRAMSREMSSEEIDAALDSSEDVLRQALELLPDEQRSRNLRSVLLVELASTMGTRSTQMLRAGTSPAEAIALFTSLREVVARARREDPTAYHPIDVLAWTTRNAIDTGLLEGPEKTEALSDVLSAFQATDIEELDPSQAGRFHSRRYEIGALIGDKLLTDDAKAELKRRGSGAAVFLAALQCSGLAGSTDRPPIHEQLLEALDILEADRELVWGDARCLDLYLDLWWLARTGRRLFEGERLSPPLDRYGWSTLLDIVTALEDLGAPRRAAALSFLRALALFHLGRLAESRDAFRAVERESMAVRSRRRVIRTYLASNADGTPKVFHGTIAWLDPGRRKGEVYVEELRREFLFLSHDFRLDDPQKGLDLGDFHIAFNFLGPIADPPIHVVK